MLRLEDGAEIEITAEPAQGTRHSLLLGRERRSGIRVAVKIGVVPGALATEHLALDWVSAHGGPAPSARAASTLRLPDGRKAECLIIEHAEGLMPESPKGWCRLGRALASLAELPWQGSDLRIYSADAFIDAHEQRIRELAESPGGIGSDVEWDRLALPTRPSLRPLVVTHGDPGPGNFLDDGDSGTLIDWEEAHIAPRGVDVARAMFIALLGAGPSGFVARDHSARARSVAIGYLTGLRDSWNPSTTELRWWLTVAAIQFAHRRWQRACQPHVQPWTHAIAVLERALRDDESWMPR